MSADFFVLLKFSWYTLYFKRTAKIIFHKCQKMTTICFNTADCFQNLHCIVKSVTWLDILEKWPYGLDVATIGFNLFASGSNNYFMGRSTTLLSFQYVKVILSWVCKRFKITSWFWFYFAFEFVLKIRWNAKYQIKYLTEIKRE